jgi:hypothetical protein
MALRAERIEVTLANALETARRAAGLSQDRFWFLYVQAGGTIGLAAFKNYLRGLSDPQWQEYDCMAKALNDALGEERLPRLPFRHSGPGVDQAVPSSDTGGYLSLVA